MVDFEPYPNVIANLEIGMAGKQGQYCRACFEPNRVENFSTLESLAHDTTSDRTVYIQHHVVGPN